MEIEDQVEHPAEKDQTRGVYDMGLGRAIVFLHGFLESNDTWKDYSKPLQKEYRTIALELPGHGSCPEKAEGKSIEQMADYVHETIKGLRVEKCLLVGHSMGGYVAMAIAEKYPETVQGLCLFNSSAMADTEEKKENRNKTIDFIKKNGMDKFSESFVKPLFEESQHKPQADAIAKHEKIAAATDKKQAVAALEAMRDRPDRTKVLKEAEFPVLFIVGKADQAVPLEKVLEQVALPANSQVLFIGKSAHMSMYEAQEDTLLVIEQFADRVFGTIRI